MIKKQWVNHGDVTRALSTEFRIASTDDVLMTLLASIVCGDGKDASVRWKCLTLDRNANVINRVFFFHNRSIQQISISMFAALFLRVPVLNFSLYLHNLISVQPHRSFRFSFHQHHPRYE